MFGRRPDGKVDKKIDPIIRMTSYIMPKRYDAQVFTKKYINYDIINDYIKKKREDGLRITHMDVIIAAYIKTLVAKPELNRFIVNKKIYQRNEMTVALTILKEKVGDELEETTIKVKFDPTDTIFDVKRKMGEEIEKNRAADEKNFTDKIARFILGIPLLPGGGIGLVKLLDRYGLLPKSILDASPFHTSMFITNMASIRMSYVYHHIYDFGTTSVFLAMGRKESKLELDKNGEVVSNNIMPMGIVIDERICSGANYAIGFSIFDKYLRHPELLEK